MPTFEPDPSAFSTDVIWDLFENAPDLVQSIRPDGRILHVNRAWRETLGYPREDIARLSVWDIVHPDHREHFRDLFRRTQAGEKLAHFETAFVAQDGRAVPLGGNCSARFADGQAVAVNGIFREIPAPQQAANHESESEERYRTLVEMAPDAILILDQDRIRYCNPAGLSLLGAGSLEGVYDTPIGVFLSAEDLAASAERRRRALTTGQPVPPRQYRITRLDGRQVDVESRGTSCTFQGQLAVLVVAHDITERKQAEEVRRRFETQILQAQKMESLGVLAGGVAHDFNNLLTVMLGYASLAAMDLASDSPVRPMLGEIEKAAQQAADLARQMLAYSGRGQFVVGILHLEALIRDMHSLLTTAISRKASLQFGLEPATIEGDATQIRQVVMNLITNASDALEGKEGVISLRTGVRFMDATSLRSPFLHDDLPVGDYGFIEIQDTGCGLSEETLPRIFDPFFTTKFAGRGLGLAAVLGIVRGHHGTLQVKSQRGKGTTFQVFFPCAAGDGEASAPPPPPAASQGSGTLLVIEDTATVRQFTRQVLEDSGFTVIEARDGHEGSEVFEQRHLEIRGVVLDMTMPHMDGVEVAQHLRRVQPGVPILLMSGYSEQEAVCRFQGISLCGFLQKPFLPGDLLARVREMLTAT